MESVFSLAGAPQVGTVTLVAAHARDERTRYRAEDVELIFGGVVGGTAKHTNQANVLNPELARLLLKAGNKSLIFSNSHVQLSFSFHESTASLESNLQVVEKNAGLFLQALPKYQSVDLLKDIGVVLEVMYPVKPGHTSTELMALVTNHIYKGPKLGPLASLDLKVGFADPDGFFINIGCSGYEVRRAEVKPAQGVQYVDFNEADLEGQGLTVSIDVNNRPTPNMARDDYQLLCSSLLRKLRALVMEGHKGFLGAEE